MNGEMWSKTRRSLLIYCLQTVCWFGGGSCLLIVKGDNFYEKRKSKDRSISSLLSNLKVDHTTFDQADRGWISYYIWKNFSNSWYGRWRNFCRILSFHFLLQDIADSRLHPDLLGDKATTQIISFPEKGAVTAAAASATSTMATTAAKQSSQKRKYPKFTLLNTAI